VATALPECTDPDDVSITVKAFLSADLLIQLIKLLEKIIIEPSPFSDDKNLQNLLLLTAIRADKGKVVGYINKLQNYDAGEIAKIATDHGEEALTIYKKYDQHAMAINVLVEHIVSIDRGLDYAGRPGRVTDRRYGADSPRHNLMVCALKTPLVIAAIRSLSRCLALTYTSRFIRQG